MKKKSIRERLNIGKVKTDLKCEVGDIVLINKFKYPDGKDGSLHSFVVMSIRKDELELVTLDYLCFIISSNMEKSSDTNSDYPYNEPILPTELSGLKTKSHVKCDYLFSNIKEDDIIMRVGMITPTQYRRFMELFKEAQKNA